MDELISALAGSEPGGSASDVEGSTTCDDCPAHTGIGTRHRSHQAPTAPWSIWHQSGTLWSIWHRQSDPRVRKLWADLRFRVVEPRGLEPLTPCLQSRCATSCAKAPREGWSQLRLTASVASAQRACSALLSSSFFFAITAPAAARAIRRSFFTPETVARGTPEERTVSG